MTGTHTYWIIAVGLDKSQKTNIQFVTFVGSAYLEFSDNPLDAKRYSTQKAAKLSKLKEDRYNVKGVAVEMTVSFEIPNL